MRRLYRDRWDKKIAGVCGGLGQFFAIDPNLIRLLLTFLSTLTVFLPLLVLYTIAWIIIPLGPITYVRYQRQSLYRSVENRKIGGLCAGIGTMLHIDPVIVRIVALVALLLTGFLPIFVTYLVGMVIVPGKPRERIE